MTAIHSFEPGDFLIFQLESGFGLLRVLDVESSADAEVWHLKAYGDLFLDTETADAAIDNAGSLKVEIPHVALTARAFESTQVARMRNLPLTEDDLQSYEAWRREGDRAIADRSIRLLLGLR